MRAAEVNQALGKYYALITRDDQAIQIRVHATAQRISYHLIDASDRLAVPVLNQAGINALSLAFLFAQSEARAGADAWSLVALDDPTQSLDAEKQKGLSQAIEELANRCSVLVATVSRSTQRAARGLREQATPHREVGTLVANRWRHDRKRGGPVKYEAYRHLKKLWQASEKEYGKLIQKLLAIAFCKAGAVRLMERSTQGIDLEVTLPDERRIALEVKTAQDRSVKVGEKDLDGLASQWKPAWSPTSPSSDRSCSMNGFWRDTTAKKSNPIRRIT